MDLYISPPTSSWTDGKMCLQRGIESGQMDDDDLASLSPPLLKQSFNTHHKQRQRQQISGNECNALGF